MRLIFLILYFLISFTSDAQFGNRNFWFKQSVTPQPPPPGTTFSFTQYNYLNTPIQNPGMGAEKWHNGSESINYPTADALIKPWDVYYRFQWVDVEPSSQGVYNWTYFDNLMEEAIDNGQQLSFGIMSVYSGQGKATYPDGRTSAYPVYLHNLMQSATANQRDFIGESGDWIPNYNSTFYHDRLRALHQAINTHILTTTYKGVRYQDAIYAIDIRGFGQWGEWHTYGICRWTTFPAGRQPTAAALKEIIDTHTEVFQDWPLSMMVGAYDGGRTGIDIFAPLPEVAFYAIQASNNWGPSGWRRDQWGAEDPYLVDLIEDNYLTYNGSLPFSTYILTKFETSPITGEVYPGAWPITLMANLEQTVIDYGATSFGNGNWGGFPSASVQNTIRAAWKRCGYRIKITTGEAPQVITRAVAFTVKTNWQNIGVTPPYNNWVVQFELQNIATSAVVWTGTSGKVLKRFKESEGIVETTDNFTVPGSVSAGAYKLVVRVRDNVNYRPNMKLFVTQPQNADGSYTIFSSVTVN